MPLAYSAFPVSQQLHMLSDIAKTYYDRPHTHSWTDVSQENLRDRVSYTIALEKGATDSIATYYSYDTHGNVKTIWHAIPSLGL